MLDLALESIKLNSSHYIDFDFGFLNVTSTTLDLLEKWNMAYHQRKVKIDVMMKVS